MPRIIKTKIVEKELSYRLVGFFYKVHQDLGRYCREKQYGDALEKYFREAKINFKREWTIVLADRKSNITREDYFQMKRYLETANLVLGLLVNFRQKYLKPKRILNSKRNIRGIRMYS